MTFAVAVLFLILFIFVEKVRFIAGLNFILAFIIVSTKSFEGKFKILSRPQVELQIVSTFALVVITWWADSLAFLALCIFLIIIFAIIGVFLPRTVMKNIQTLNFLFFNIRIKLLIDGPHSGHCSPIYIVLRFSDNSQLHPDCPSNYGGHHTICLCSRGAGNIYNYFAGG